MPGQELRRSERLRAKHDIQRCYQHGRRIKAKHLAVYFAPNRARQCRIGVTASRKVGRATVRNRLKRQAREIYRQWPTRRQLPHLDLVVHFYPRASEASFAELEQELCTILRQLVSH